MPGDYTWVIRQSMSLDAFLAWLSHEQEQWEAQGLKVDIGPVSQGRSKNSMGVSLETDRLWGMIRVWDSGEWEVAKFDRVTQDDEWSEYQPASSVEELIAKVGAQLQRMGFVQ
jgi:hypothetical protein